MKKEEIVNSFTAMKENSYKTDVYFKELEKLQEQICNTIMPEVMNKKGWYTELINQFEEYKFDDENVENVIKPRFIDTAKKMANEIRIKKCGNRGERNVTNFLKEAQTYFEESCLLNNICIKCDDITVEIDNVFISPSCIFIIETKNWTKSVHINYCGEIFKDNKLEINKNIINSMSNKRRAIWSVLRDNGLRNINIQEVIVNANPHNFIKNDSKKLTILNNTSDIVTFITNNNSNVCYNDENIRNMETIIKDNIYSETYPVEYDIEQFKSDAAELILALNGDKNEIEMENDSDSDTRTYLINLLKESFSLKKCAIYALMIGAAAITGNYIKIKL